MGLVPREYEQRVVDATNVIINAHNGALAKENFGGVLPPELVPPRVENN
jgi:hypothetical protein